MEYGLFGGLEPIVWIFYIFSMLFVSILLYIGIPLFALRVGRPVSRRGLSVRLLIYTAFILLMYAAVLCEAFDYSLNNVAEAWEESDKGTFILVTVIGFMPFAFIPVVWCIMCNTNKVDVRLPQDYILVRPVKANVTESGENAGVEYNGKKYLFAKSFEFKLRDKVKVRIIEGREYCYLA